MRHITPPTVPQKKKSKRRLGCLVVVLLFVLVIVAINWRGQSNLAEAERLYKEGEKASIRFTYLRRWKPNRERNGFGADILLQQDPNEAELVSFIRDLAGDHDPAIIRVFTSLTAYEDEDATTAEFKSDYILFYIRNGTGRGIYRGFHEIRWMQEVGRFSANYGKKTKF